MPTWTQAEYDALKAKVATAVQRIADGDRSVGYAELTQMRELLSEMEQSLGLNTDPRYTLATHSRD